MRIVGAITDGQTKTLRERPGLVMGKTSNPVKPTVVEYGAFLGYSFPIFNSDDEQLNFRCNVPRRWDGTTDPTVTIIGYLSAAETADDDFQMQLSWASTPGDNTDHVLSNATQDVKSGNINCPDGRNDQYQVFAHSFTVDVSAQTPAVAAGDVLSFKLIRVAVEAGGVEIAGEFVVIDVYITWTFNTMFP